MEISIAMATYNGEKFVKQQIDSILIQTFKEFELIICDDCSTDSTVDILKSYSMQDPRVKVFQNEENIGFAKNFEKIISLCSCEYIAFCDQDDIWENNHLEILFEKNQMAKVVCGNELLFDNETKQCRLKIPYEENLFPSDSQNLLWTFAYTNNLFSGNSMLVERKFLFEKNILPIPDGIAHDSWIVLCACCYSQMKFVQTYVTKRRLHDANTTGLKINDKKMTNRIKNRFWGRKKRKNIYRRIVFMFEKLIEKTEISDNARQILVNAISIAQGKVSPVGSLRRVKGCISLWNNYEKIFFWEKRKSLLKLFVYFF